MLTRIMGSSWLRKAFGINQVALKAREYSVLDAFDVLCLYS